VFRKLFATLLVVCFVSSFAELASAYGYDPEPPKQLPVISKMERSEVDLRDGMRKLWSDHVIWTRMFIVSAVANMPETALNAERLLQNQQGIGNAIKPYYGNAAGEKLASLLKDHILIAADIVTAAKSGDTGAVGDREKRWMENADDIAAFLSSANPNWAKKDLQNMLYQHLNLTKGELLSRLNSDYTGDIKGFDNIYMEALMMADSLSDGIVKQFPAKFGKK
jgi:hypothetical protein